MNNARFRVLVVDRERSICAGIQETLRREGYVVEVAYDARKALESLRLHAHQAVIADVALPDGSGMQLLQLVRRHHPQTQFILTTTFGTVVDAVEAIRSGAYDYLIKPLDLRRLAVLVAKALEYGHVVAENQELRQQLRTKAEPLLLVGESEPIRKVLRVAQEVARSNVAVLIEGESGTGKELVARTIHSLSARAAKPFISFNCAAFDEHVVEPELFGHVKGVLAGAVTSKRGRFQLADGGTLFLDEIDELPPRGQADLLRVLEDGGFRMVGGTELVRVDVRVIAASSKRLHDLVASGRFREDLYYRLRVVPILVPPLRGRAEDIPLLVEAFLEHFAVKHKRRRLHLTAEAMQRCRDYAWPGNVRQMRNALERLVVTCTTPTAGVADLPEFLQAQDAAGLACEIRPGMTIADCEKLLIRQTLANATTNREQAARLLGISRRTLQYKLKSYGLLPPNRLRAVAAPPRKLAS